MPLPTSVAVMYPARRSAGSDCLGTGGSPPPGTPLRQVNRFAAVGDDRGDEEEEGADVFGFEQAGGTHPVVLAAVLVNLDGTLAQPVAERVELVSLGPLDALAGEEALVVRRLPHEPLVAAEFLTGKRLPAFKPACCEPHEFASLVLVEPGGDERFVGEFAVLEAGDEFERAQRDRLSGVPLLHLRR